MIGYVTVGADDIARAKTFYSAFLPKLGFVLSESDAGLSFSVPAGDNRYLPADFYVKPPLDGDAASAGNGAMVAFEVPSQQAVRAMHAAAVAAGGSDEGAPGFRPAYSAGFYVGYLRDPQGNKVALFCNNSAEPSRTN
ncbi:Catechol 2,3-dioxygenase [Pseudorhodobacter antarcticus]|jgi:catechol 2,3-dioxygenase-like lactoylglutathione lyase family enzyme|uniref:Catechol 2,3-dioxygenase n=1 Tax=Pseudorhodobacter antarcticus TaxID=1077947 RepID=A0A1H8BKG5_9RHOB|nr:VOC family protein [Pseudorhodobacter antarcticus]SEM82548.1 Catechol 2,3-dioxygenase [Pseudorhodobacter antarcticus]